MKTENTTVKKSIKSAYLLGMLIVGLFAMGDKELEKVFGRLGGEGWFSKVLDVVFGKGVLGACRVNGFYRYNT